MNRLLEERREHQEKGENGYESKRRDKERTKKAGMARPAPLERKAPQKMQLTW